MTMNASPQRGFGNAEAEGAEPDEAVDPGRDEHRRHQRGDAARRRRMGLGQPDMQRDDAGLHAEAEEEEHEQHARAVGPDTTWPASSAGERLRACGRRQNQEAGDEAAGADVRHDQVEVRGAPAGARFVFGGDERGGRQRHHFPREQEPDHGVGDEHHLQRAEQHIERRADERRCAARRPRARGSPTL